MVVYFVAIVLSLALCFVSQQCKAETVSPVALRAMPNLTRIHENKNGSIYEKLMYAASFMPLFLISALRWNTGTDSWHTYSPEYLGMKWKLTGILTQSEANYMRLCASAYYTDAFQEDQKIIMSIFTGPFERIRDHYASVSDHTSIAFRAIERVLIAFNASAQWLYVVTSLIILVLVFVAIYRQSENRTLAILFFVITSNFFLSLNIISQFIAIALCLVACEFAEKRKPVFFILTVTLAVLFHSSAFVFFIVYFLPKLRIKPKWCLLAVTACFFLAPLFTPVVKWLVGILIPKYARYFSHGKEFEWIFFLLGLMVLVISTYYYEKLKDKPYFSLWYYANIIGLLALCFSSQLPEMKRINYYFAAPHFMLLPMLIQAETDKKKKLILKWGLIAFFVAEQ